MAKRLPKTLYHYCSLQTFKSIIENKSIWLSDIRKSNDSKELEWIKGKSEYYLLKTWVDYLNSMDNEQRFQKVSSDDFKRVDELKELISNFNDIKTWAFCLSEKKDDLSQWRGYADDGTGISIGFNGKYFKALQLINGLNDGNEDLFFTNVNYFKCVKLVL